MSPQREQPRSSLFRSSFFLFLFILSFLGGFSCVAQDDAAEITGLSGTVEVSLGEEDYVPAEEGMELEAGDRIRTSAGGSAELSFNEENTNVVRLGEDAQASVTLQDEEKMALDKGEAFASIASLPADSSFEIRTPTAVTGARGTDWVTRVSDEGTDVEAIDDNPYVKPIGQDGTVSRQLTQVRAGYATTVRKFQPPMAPRALAAADRARWQQVKTQVRQRAARAYDLRPQRPRFDRKAFISQQKELKGVGASGQKAGVLDSGKKAAPLGASGVLKSYEGKPAAGQKEGAAPAAADPTKKKTPGLQAIRQLSDKPAEAKDAQPDEPEGASKSAPAVVKKQTQGTVSPAATRAVNRARLQTLRVVSPKR
jgi:hypothetical protein